MSASGMRSPAPRANADRAEFIRTRTSHTIDRREPEGDFATRYIASRYRLPTSIAAVIAALLSLGRAIQ